MTVDFEWQVFALVAVLLLVLLWLLYRRSKHKKTAAYRLDKILKPLKQDEVRQIIIPDGIGGLLEIENLILMEQGLLIVETYPISGNLFGAENIDQWTQIIEGRSFKFANPLRHVRNAREGLKLLAPKVPVFCRVVFTADSHFPKGKPGEVSVLDTLTEDIADLHDAPLHGELTRKGWERIMRIARHNGQSVLRDN